MAEKRAQSCAACKHQRKKCKPESCLLAPFFPAERGREFQAVHKVFGVSNVQKMIQVVDTQESRAIAAESLIWEATWRLREPIHGCWADHKRLQDQVRALQEQAQLLKLQLSKLMRINGNFEQQNYGVLQSAKVGYGGIGTTNNDMINHINFCSSTSRTQTQHNLDCSFTGN